MLDKCLLVIALIALVAVGYYVESNGADHESAVQIVDCEVSG